mgnify:CR=1 FL=1
MKKLLLLIIFLSCWTLLPAQLSYGTTGLLHAPSADMQKDKTVMLGGNFLHQELTPPKFNLIRGIIFERDDLPVSGSSVYLYAVYGREPWIG